MATTPESPTPVSCSSSVVEEWLSWHLARWNRVGHVHRGGIGLGQHAVLDGPLARNAYLGHDDDEGDRPQVPRDASSSETGEDVRTPGCEDEAGETAAIVDDDDDEACDVAEATLDPIDADGPVALQQGASLDELKDVAPGLELAHVLESLDVDEVDEYGLVEVVAAYKRLEGWIASRTAQAAAALSERPALNARLPVNAKGEHVPTNLAADELAPRLGLSRYSARRLVSNGLKFQGELTQTGDALKAGLLDYTKADLVSRHLDHLPLQVTVAVEAEVLDHAPYRTRRQLSNDIATAIIAVAPDEADTRTKKAIEKRRVNQPRPLPDGMASIYAVLPAADAVGLHLALKSSAHAAKNGGDQRTIDQLQADSLALMANSALDAGYIGHGTNSPGPSCCGGNPHEADRSATHETERSGAKSPAHHTPHPHQTEAQSTTRPAGTAATTSCPGEAQGPSLPQPLPPTSDEGTGMPTSPRPQGASPPPAAGDSPPPGVGASPPASTPEARLAVLPAPGEACPTSSAPRVRLGTIGGGRAQIHVTIPMTALMPAAPGTPDHDPLSDKPVDVADLEGYGPIPPAVARALAMGGAWQRLVTDPVSGAILDVGRTRYQPPAALADHVRHRDGGCIAPGCSVSSRSCDIDHMQPWEADGATTKANLQLLCPRHHQIKTIGAFTSRRLPDGTYEYLSTITGHAYHRGPTGIVTQLPRQQATELRLLASGLSTDELDGQINDNADDDEPPF